MTEASNREVTYCWWEYDDGSWAPGCDSNTHYFIIADDAMDVFDVCPKCGGKVETQ